MSRLLGVDYGRARIGLALSDPLGISATALGFIRREHDAQAAGLVVQLAAQHACAAIIVGNPVNADGSHGANARWVKDFCGFLRRRTALPVHRVDERWSSAEAEDELRQLGRWPCDPGWLDAQAAAIILRRHLASSGTAR